MSSSSSHSIQDLLERLDSLGHGESLSVTGWAPSALAWIALQIGRKCTAPLALVVPTQDEVFELGAALEAMSSLVDPQSKVLCLPTWEPTAFSSIRLSLRTRHERVSTLAALAEGPTQGAPAVPKILVSTPLALQQATTPPQFFQKTSLLIRSGAELPHREALVQKLREAGYGQVDPVEDPGTFAVRGEIIDLFPVHFSKPVRIELFDVQVERIRFFSPETQRTEKENLKEIWIPPCREVLIHPETRDLLRQRLKGFADHHGIHRRMRDPIIEAVALGEYPDHSDAWAPFTYEKPSTAWDYLPSESMILWKDSVGAIQGFESFLNDQDERLEECLQSGILLPPPSDLFQKSQLEALTSRFTHQIDFNQVELLDLKSGEEEAPPSRTCRLSVSPVLRKTPEPLEERVRRWLEDDYRVIVFAQTPSQKERLQFLLEQKKVPTSRIQFQIGDLFEGFCWPVERLAVLTEDEILGKERKRRSRRGKSHSTGGGPKNWSGLQVLSDLAVGDRVVHIDHGVGKYRGLVRLELGGAASDFLQLEYANQDKLYLPVYRLNLIQKHAGGSDAIPLNRLGGQQFEKAKAKVRESIQKIAFDLIELYAKRKIQTGFKTEPRAEEYLDFEAKFPFDETDDQLKAIESTLDDLESGKLMDRLICGDVGYGKTEVAIRAAFQTVMSGKQVAVLVPTTILAHQHEASFRERLKDFPFKIHSVSRLKSRKEVSETLEALKKGNADVLIGTHRLLSKDIRFKDLGLMVVDEEHRFGVEHKEKLKALKTNTHALTLTATPIPRTLQMALSGLREISLITTPPIDRLPIRTFVAKFDEALVQRAIEFELSKGGQVFFVHHRVQTIAEIAKKISEISPNAKIVIAHGQMGERELEKSMIQFYQKEANVLVCTKIIESGLDIPSANTIIINRADTFGLAELYQLRGRVGRGDQRAYAYLLVSKTGKLTDDAKKRLDAIQRFVELGSGFNIASHDLEIRGGGNLLGPQQSGHVASVGFDLYTEMLEEAIAELQGQPAKTEAQKREPEIKVPFASYLSETYIPDVHQRLSLYRRLSTSKDEAEVEALERELLDRFGPLEEEGQNLLWIIRLKHLLRSQGIDVLVAGPGKVSLLPNLEDTKIDPSRVLVAISSHPNKIQLVPEGPSGSQNGPQNSKIILHYEGQSLSDLFFEVERWLREFAANPC